MDLGPTLALGGVFAPIRSDRAIFQAATVDPEGHTIVWPGDVDLDPWVLRGIHAAEDGVPLARRVIVGSDDPSPRDPGLTSM